MVVTLVDAVSVTPLNEHPVPFLILEFPYVQLLEIHICIWKPLFPGRKSFLKKQNLTQWIWKKTIVMEKTVWCGGVMKGNFTLEDETRQNFLLREGNTEV